MILALESVFEQCSVALLTPMGEVLDEHTLAGSRMQTQHILPMIQDSLAKQGIGFDKLTAIAFDRGPGAFSGIRINTAVAQALAFAHDLPCLPVSSLQAVAQLAWQAHGFTQVYAVTDARMHQVYFGEFVLVDDVMQLVGSEQLTDYGSESLAAWPLVGNGADLLHVLPAQQVVRDCVPTAATIGKLGVQQLRLGQAVSAEQALPVYLRHNAWKTLSEQKAAADKMATHR